MARRSARFVVEGIEPANDPAWIMAGPAVRRAFWRAVVAYGIKAHDRQQAAGLDRFGRTLVPIKASTRKYRDSAMGPADPNAPPLTPAYGVSRTRLNLTGRALEDRAEFYWTDGWGRVLLIHARGSRRGLPVRDVIGLSPDSLKLVRNWALGWWLVHKRTGAPPVAKIKATTPKALVQDGTNDYRRFTFGIGTGADQKREARRAERLFAAGRSTGFRQRVIGEGPPPPGPATGPPPRPTPPPPPKPKPKPLSPEAYPVIRRLGGSTGAALVRDEAGREFVRKFGASPEHLREEAAADALYRALGARVPGSTIHEGPGGGKPIKLAEFVEGVSLAELERTDPKRYAAAVKELRKGFAADALLGNWDVVGLGADNVLVTPEGHVYRIDNGGSLRFRAQGQPKGANWSAEVGEITSLRSPEINPSAAKVFGDLTDAQVKTQITTLLKKRAAILDAAPPDLRDVLAARLDTMKAWAESLPRKWKPSPASKFQPVPAGREDDWGDEHFGAWKRSLSTDETAAIRAYAGSDYRWMNAILRTGDYGPAERSGVDRSEADRLIGLARTGLRKAKAPAPIVVHRAVRDAKEIGIDPNTVTVGAKYQFKGFLSTTVKEGAFEGGNVRIELRLPAGTPGGYLNAIGVSYSHEKEFLVPDGHATFRLVSLTEEGRLTKVVMEWAKD